MNLRFLEYGRNMTGRKVVGSRGKKGMEGNRVQGHERPHSTGHCQKNSRCTVSFLSQKCVVECEHVMS